MENGAMGRYHHDYAYYAWLDVHSPTIRYEFIDGHICPMLDTPEHDALAANVISALTDLAARRRCRVHGRDLRIYVPGLAAHADAAVIWGPLQQNAANPDATARNPMVLVEVTSDATEAYDAITKLELYRTIPTLRDYVLVSHREPRITVHSRGAHEWTTAVAKSGEIELPSLDAKLSVGAIYRVTSAD
jgi:Uma2 family endonuclease